LILGVILVIGAAFMVIRVVFDTIEERFTNQILEAGQSFQVEFKIVLQLKTLKKRWF